MHKHKLTYKPFGDSAILIGWPARIDEEIINDIVAFEKILVEKQYVLDTVIAYNSLTVRYRNLDDLENTIEELKELYTMELDEVSKSKKLWKIPVSYDVEFGLDLIAISKIKKITIDEVIRIHSETTYLIYFLGFQPGFLYLGGLNSKIHIPRKSTPRLRVEKGSVGIGGAQTGVYPQDSSGGWNIIGKSPINFFDVHQEIPCFAKAGDLIKFEPIDLNTFYKIKEAIVKGKYTLNFEEL